MPKTQYTGFEINQVQFRIMKFINSWVHMQKSVVPYREVILEMQKHDVQEPTTQKALYSLIHKGYIRKAYTSSNKTFFVQLRNV